MLVMPTNSTINILLSLYQRPLVIHSTNKTGKVNRHEIQRKHKK